MTGLLLLSVLLLLISVEGQEHVVVNLPGLGSLRGKELLARNNDKFFSFRGVPFAAPPVGQMRFRRPGSVEPWQGIRDALDYQQLCLQSPYSDPTKVCYGNRT